MSKAKILVMGLLAATLGMGATGCASTSITKVSKAAPITYKIGPGSSTQMASLSAPTTPRAIPRAYQPVAPIAPIAPQIHSFDQASVDLDLYKHQRVGKTYKIKGKSYTPKHQPRYDKTGVASWYGDKFHGKPTATGEKYDMYDLTAAHKTLPLNSMLFVTNLETGQSLMVRLNDRGPFIGDRIIDLSKASAQALGITSQGLGKVRVQYAGPADPMAASSRVPVRPAQPVPAPLDNFVEAPYVPQAPKNTPSMPFTAPQAAPVMPSPVMPSPMVPGAPQAVKPSADEPKGGEVTLTIKGPIHVANYTGDTPKWIRGVAPGR